MEFIYENVVKYKFIFGVVCNLVNIKIGFKDVFVEFVGSVIEFVNFCFKRMKLKDEYLKVYIGILDEEI